MYGVSNSEFARAQHGWAWLQAGRPDLAIGYFQKVLNQSPGNVAALLGFGRAALQMGDATRALQAFNQALARDPAQVEVHTARAEALLELHRPLEAEAACGKVLSVQAQDAGAHMLRGQALLMLERTAEALESYQRAAELLPTFAPVHCNVGTILIDLGRPDEAVLACRRALALDPTLIGAHMSLGTALQWMGEPEAALESFARATALAPQCAEAHWNASLCLLQLGRYEEGWREHEWRKLMDQPLGNRQFPSAQWRGHESLVGKSLRVYSEQGLGDTLQFCRFAKLVRATGAKVVLSVQHPLMALLRTLDPDVIVIAEEESVETDFNCALMSLPGVLGTSLESIPDAGGYLRADAARVRSWRERLGYDGFKVGIRWQGRGGIRADVGRSFPLANFAPLAAISGVRLISLQKGVGVAQLSELPPGFMVECVLDADEGPDSFLDTAALIASLDLVISCDTSVSHLAGSLGHPTWLALGRASDWRWHLHRSDSPWYRSLRIFRQARWGDWAGVVAEMHGELTHLVTRGRACTGAPE